MKEPLTGFHSQVGLSDSLRGQVGAIGWAPQLSWSSRITGCISQLGGTACWTLNLSRAAGCALGLGGLLPVLHEWAGFTDWAPWLGKPEAWAEPWNKTICWALQPGMSVGWVSMLCRVTVWDSWLDKPRDYALQLDKASGLPLYLGRVIRKGSMAEPDCWLRTKFGQNCQCETWPEETTGSTSQVGGTVGYPSHQAPLPSDIQSTEIHMLVTVNFVSLLYF